MAAVPTDVGRKSYWCAAALACCYAWAPAGAAGLPGYAIETMAGSANQGDGGAATAAQFGTIKGIAVDGRGNLYIADTDHNQVRQVNAAGAVSTLAGTGTAGYSGDGGSAAAAQLNLPYGVAADAAGYVYVADYGNSVVRRISPDGAIRTYAGNGQAGYSGDGGQATSARILSPRNVAVDAAGNLYISEFGGHHVRKVAPNGVITTVAGTGIAGYSGDGGPATAAQLHSPAGLALDRYGALYIADSGNGCVRVVQNGLISTRGNFLSGIVDVAVGSDLSLYAVVAQFEVWALNSAPGSQWYVRAGANGPGFSGDGGNPLAAQLSAASDLALTAQADLFVADGARVREIVNLLTGADHPDGGWGRLSGGGRRRRPSHCRHSRQTHGCSAGRVRKAVHRR